MKPHYLRRTFIFIHGAWHNKSCWDDVVAPLEEEGHRAMLVDLPGHGELKDKYDFDKISLQTYVKYIEDIVKKQEEPVVLAGHSMAGMIISQVAENMPDKIQALAYICAFVPRDGDSIFSMIEGHKHKRVAGIIQIDKKASKISIDKKKAADIFYNITPKAKLEHALNNLGDQPLAPFESKVSLSEENYGRVPKIYIECPNDMAIDVEDQRSMHKDIEFIMRMKRADHSPFYCAPNDLARYLNQIENKGFITLLFGRQRQQQQY